MKTKEADAVGVHYLSSIVSCAPAKAWWVHNRLNERTGHVQTRIYLNNYCTPRRTEKDSWPQLKNEKEIFGTRSCQPSPPTSSISTSTPPSQQATERLTRKCFNEWFVAKSQRNSYICIVIIPHTNTFSPYGIIDLTDTFHDASACKLGHHQSCRLAAGSRECKVNNKSKHHEWDNIIWSGTCFSAKRV